MARCEGDPILNTASKLVNAQRLVRPLTASHLRHLALAMSGTRVSGSGQSQTLQCLRHHPQHSCGGSRRSSGAPLTTLRVVSASATNSIVGVFASRRSPSRAERRSHLWLHAAFVLLKSQRSYHRCSFGDREPAGQARHRCLSKTQPTPSLSGIEVWSTSARTPSTSSLGGLIWTGHRSSPLMREVPKLEPPSFREGYPICCFSSFTSTFGGLRPPPARLPPTAQVSTIL